jgi:hypothetical protein
VDVRTPHNKESQLIKQVARIEAAHFTGLYAPWKSTPDTNAVRCGVSPRSVSADFTHRLNALALEGCVDGNEGKQPGIYWRY